MVRYALQKTYPCAKEYGWGGMQVGFNNNLIYKGESYHVQTEDGGRSSPVITTLLFKGGVILASKKTSYADIIKFDKLDMVVREIMREQHAKVIRELKNGLYDSKIKGKEGIERKPPEIVEGERLRDGEMVLGKSMDEIILEYLASEDDS